MTPGVNARWHVLMTVRSFSSSAATPVATFRHALRHTHPRPCPHGPLALWVLFGRVLVAMDRATSFALGRPCAIQDEE